MGDVNVKVRYLGLLKNTVGCGEESLSLPRGVYVSDVFRMLSEKYGEQFSSVVFRADGGLRPMTRVLLNDCDIRDGDGVETVLEGNPEMSLTVGIYPTSGGYE